MDQAAKENSSQSGTSPGHRVHFGRFLLVLLPLTVCFYLLPFALVRQTRFDRWLFSPLQRSEDYSFHARGVDADVVIVGESSALYGVDPHSINARLGVKTINLVNNVSTFPVAADLELQRYFRDNRRPRLLIVYADPWNTDFDKLPYANFYDGIVVLSRYGGRGRLMAFARAHTQAFLLFPFQFYSANDPLSMWKKSRGSDATSAILLAGGHTIYQTRRLVEPGCRLPPVFNAHGLHPRSVAALMDQFRGSADQVIYYASPVPACSNIAEKTAIPYGEVGAKPPAVMPAQAFEDDSAFAHLDDAWVPQSTDLLIDTIRPILANSAPHR